MSSKTTGFAELPKFKDKVMYMTGANTNSKLQKSYTISSSFKGIVRLSPNNHTIFAEDSTHQLSQEDEKIEGLLYSDSITFEQGALAAMKSNCDIKRRMIIASQSTGYFVNFRISDRDVQFDNLGIIGMAKTQHITLYSTDNTHANKSFLLNGKRMPTRASDTVNNVYYTTKQRDVIASYDQKKVIVTGDGDKSELLYGIIDQNNQRTYRYKRTRLFIRDAIMQALLSLQTIPTGSIHFVPVTIAQYKELCKKQKPNMNLEYDSNGVPTTDPIVRDFLLCDGRQYFTRDFPELAKTLWNEYIKIWKPVTGTAGNPFLYPLENSPTEEQGHQVNNYNEQGNKKTFRVPDLRHMFIAAVPAQGQVGFNFDEVITVNNNFYNNTGSYFPDNLPVYSQKYKADDHRHFVAYGTYSASLFSSTADFHTSSVNNYITTRFSFAENDKRLNTISGGGRCGIMYLTNHPFYMGYDYYNGFGCRNHAGGNMANGARVGRNQTGVDAVPAHFWASIPMPNNGKPKTQQSYPTDVKAMAGHSSIQVPSLTDTSGYTALFGRENNPNFWAMIPLIKI